MRFASSKIHVPQKNTEYNRGLNPSLFYALPLCPEP